MHSITRILITSAAALALAVPSTAGAASPAPVAAPTLAGSPAAAQFGALPRHHGWGAGHVRRVCRWTPTGRVCWFARRW